MTASLIFQDRPSGLKANPPIPGVYCVFIIVCGKKLPKLLDIGISHDIDGDINNSNSVNRWSGSAKHNLAFSFCKISAVNQRRQVKAALIRKFRPPLNPVTAHNSKLAKRTVKLCCPFSVMDGNVTL